MNGVLSAVAAEARPGDRGSDRADRRRGIDRHPLRCALRGAGGSSSPTRRSPTRQPASACEPGRRRRRTWPRWPPPGPTPTWWPRTVCPPTSRPRRLHDGYVATSARRTAGRRARPGGRAGRAVAECGARRGGSAQHRSGQPPRRDSAWWTAAGAPGPGRGVGRCPPAHRTGRGARRWAWCRSGVASTPANTRSAGVAAAAGLVRLGDGGGPRRCGPSATPPAPTSPA